MTPPERDARRPAWTETTITPEELKAKRDRGEAVVLVDVREAYEWAINRIEGATHIPLLTLPRRARELNPEDEIVVYCKMGERSAQAVYYLQELGFRRARNLDGGIDAWIERVDTTLRGY